jgi:hypothetical protein
MSSLSPTAISIITLLNNINDLILKSNDRKSARDVMSALKVYAKEKRFDIPEERVDQFNAILLDSRPMTISFLLRKMTQDIINSDKHK